MKSELINQAELARRIGVTPAAVTKAARTGRIPIAKTDDKGRNLFDYEIVMLAWHANTTPNQQRVGEGRGYVKTSSNVANAGRDTTPTGRRRGRPPGEAKAKDAATAAERLLGRTQNESRSLKEYYAAEKAKLDHDVAAGLLVAKEEVRLEMFSLARRVRDAILNVADRIDAQLAATTSPREINTMLKRELIQAMESLVTDVDQPAEVAAQ